MRSVSQTPLAPEAAPLLKTLQQQQKNFLKPGIIVETYQKMATNWIRSKMMQRAAFSTQKPNTMTRMKEPRIKHVGISLSLSNIYFICPMKPERKNVLHNTNT